MNNTVQFRFASQYNVWKVIHPSHLQGVHFIFSLISAALQNRKPASAGIFREIQGHR
jgi:hypothetical protein